MILNQLMEVFNHSDKDFILLFGTRGEDNNIDTKCPWANISSYSVIRHDPMPNTFHQVLIIDLFLPNKYFNKRDEYLKFIRTKLYYMFRSSNHLYIYDREILYKVTKSGLMESRDNEMSLLNNSVMVYAYEIEEGSDL